MQLNAMTCNPGRVTSILGLDLFGQGTCPEDELDSFPQSGPNGFNSGRKMTRRLTATLPESMEVLPQDFYLQDTVIVARELLGKYLVKITINKSERASWFTVGKSKRIGIRKAAEEQYRFSIADSPAVSAKS